MSHLRWPLTRLVFVLSIFAQSRASSGLKKEESNQKRRHSNSGMPTKVTPMVCVCVSVSVSVFVVQLLLNERLRDERRNPPARRPDAGKPPTLVVSDTKGSMKHRGDVIIHDSAPSMTYKLRRFDVDTAKLQGLRGTTRGAAFRAAIPPQARRTHALSPQQALASRLINAPE